MQNKYGSQNEMDCISRYFTIAYLCRDREDRYQKDYKSFEKENIKCKDRGYIKRPHSPSTPESTLKKATNIPKDNNSHIGPNFVRNLYNQFRKELSLKHLIHSMISRGSLMAWITQQMIKVIEIPALIQKARYL